MELTANGLVIWS